MATTGKHLAEITSLSSGDTCNVVISQHKDIVLSRYDDDVWDLSPYIQRKNSGTKKIKFDVVFSDKSCLTDPQNSNLKNSAKRFLYARWKTKAPHSRKYISAQTLYNNWVQLRTVLKWMVKNKIKSFSQFTSNFCLQYARDYAKEVSASTLTISLQVLTTYFDLRDHLLDKLPEYPWGDSVPSVLARGNKSQGKEALTEVIPTRILRLLLKTALDLIENRSDELLSIQEKIISIQKEKLDEVTVSHENKHPNGFSSIYDEDETYLKVRASHASSKPILELITQHNLSSHAEFKEALLNLRTACYVVLAIFSGMRDSELASLEVGCFKKREGYDGETYSWLSGNTYKTEEDPTPAEWMVAEIVEKAVTVATRLGAAGRARCQLRIENINQLLLNSDLADVSRKKLIIDLESTKKHQYSLLFTEKEEGKIQTFGSMSAHKFLKRFASLAEAYITPADLEGIKDHTKIKVGEIWPLAPHQFRRTFAVYVARNLLGDVRYLREHFKHWSIDMTLYYSTHDSDLDLSVISEVLTERDELQAIILEKWISTKESLSGGSGKRIMSFRNRGEVKTVKDMRDFCRNIGEDVFIRGTGHSWCMASGNSCGGHGLYDALRCVECNEAVIDSTHLRIWQGIRDQQIDVLQCDDIGFASKERCIDHLKQAEKILTELGGKYVPYNFLTERLE